MKLIKRILTTALLLSSSVSHGATSTLSSGVLGVAGITQLTGDGTTPAGTGSQPLTFATVNGNVGSFTYGSFTVNAKGLITAASSGTAPVTSLTVASANGFTGSSSGGQTPALTIGTSITGNVCGNGTAISACSVTGSGSTVLATSPTITTPTIVKLANLTTNGYVKTSGGDGTLSVQTVAIPVADGGTGLTGGTSGGIPYYSGASTIASSGALSQYQVVLGGGAGGAPNVVSGTGTSGQVLTSNGAGTNPTWQAAGGGGGSSSEGLPSYANSNIVTSTGLFTWTVPAGVYKVAVLVVGAGSGGGGGDTLSGAGGGAGGCVIYKRDYAVTPGAVIRGQVGVGGTAGTGVNDSTGGGNSLVTASSASAFGSLLAPMGMTAGGASGSNPGTVGCHGGGTGNGTQGGTAIYTPDFFSGITANLISYAGHWPGGTSAGTANLTRLGGGGGGAGGAGGNAVNVTTAGAGGAGVAIDIDGTTRYFGGGGGGGSYNNVIAGGTGGTGGGGAGGSVSDGTAGTANTGGGGGGAGGGATNGATIRNGGNGGSGTVEIYWD